MTKSRSQPYQSLRATPEAVPASVQLLVDELVSPDVARREQARKDLVGLGQTVTEVLTLALATSDDRYRWRILVVLSEIADRRAIPGVMACLQSSSPAIRIAAAQFLGDIGAVEAVDALMDVLQRNSDDQSSIWIVQALGKLGDRRAVPLLVDTMHRTESTAVRYTAIEALTSIGDSRVIYDIRRYVTDPSHHVQTRAITALEKLTRV